MEIHQKSMPSSKANWIHGEVHRERLEKEEANVKNVEDEVRKEPRPECATVRCFRNRG